MILISFNHQSMPFDVFCTSIIFFNVITYNLEGTIQEFWGFRPTLLWNVQANKINFLRSANKCLALLYVQNYIARSKLFWTGTKLLLSDSNCFENGSKSKIMYWKVIFGPVQNYLDLSKTFWTNRRTRQSYFENPKNT